MLVTHDTSQSFSGVPLGVSSVPSDFAAQQAVSAPHGFPPAAVVVGRGKWLGLDDEDRNSTLVGGVMPISVVVLLASLLPVALLYWRLDPKAPVREGGHIAPPDGPGLGVSPDPEMLGAPILDLTG